MVKKISAPKAVVMEAEFARLFWLARKALLKFRNKAIFCDADYQVAVSFAKKQKWQWAEALLKASRANAAGVHDKALKLLADVESSIPDRCYGLFHFVQGAALSGKGEHEKAIEDYRKALDDSTYDRRGYAWNNLGNALSCMGKFDEAIEAYRRALDDPLCDTHASVWSNLGSALNGKGVYDEAIEAYRKALDDPKYETPGYAWNNLGNAYSGKGEHDEAIKAYRKALDDSKYDTPGYAWNNIGNALSDKGKHNEAIKAYRKALDDPKFETPGTVWNNLGAALSDKGKHDEAIKAYRRALRDPKIETPARIWANLGQTYAEVGKTKQAEDAFNKALECPDPQGSEYARARLGLQLLKSKIKSEALSPDDRAIVEKAVAGGSDDEIESEVIAAIQLAGATQYDKYIAKPDSKRDDALSILRGWSSAVTLLEGSERRWRGGGYFLKWNGYGVVIDPGFDFLRNFHDAGFHGREIHAVVVSHNHPDHNSEVKDIDDLRYELFKRLAATGKSGSQPYLLLCDQDTNGVTNFGIEKPKHHYETVILPCGFPQPINLQKHAATIPLQITPFKVNHGSDVPHAMGMVLELLDKKGKPVFRIGYTADTAYYDELHKHLTNCDILIAHISQPTIEELQDASKLKDVHLGYRGTARLLKECKPKLALIGEFWAGFTDLRISLVKGLRQRSGVTAIFPAGLAMHLKLPSLEIECTECKKPAPFSEIKVAPPTENFGSLAYLCPSCMIG